MNFSEHRFKLHHRLVPILLVVSSALAVVNIAEYDTIKKLRLEAANNALANAPRQGSSVSSLEGYDASGQPTRLNLAAFKQPILAFVISPKCT